MAIGKITECSPVVAGGVEECIDVCALISERSECSNMRGGERRLVTRLVSTNLNKLTADEVKQLQIQDGAPILYSGGAYLDGHTHTNKLDFAGGYCRDFFLYKKRFTYYVRISKDVIMAMWRSSSEMGDIEDGGRALVTFFRICDVGSVLEVL